MGAGPAGSASAQYLARAGYKVILLDKVRFPRDKICGDFLSPVSQLELSKLSITHTKEFKNANQVTKASVYLDGKQLVSRVVPKVQGLPHYGRVMPRYVLDKLLLDAACAEGVVFLEGWKAVTLRMKQREVELEAEGPKERTVLKASLLIGADGSNSTIARTFRAPPSISDRIIAIRGYFENVKGLCNQADLHFNRESFPGYCWLFPTGKTTANVGVGVVLETIPSGYRPKELLFRLINNNEALRDRLKGAKLIGQIRGWPLTTYNSSLPFVDDRIILVGDAAGLVNPLNGEGIQHALLSGRWASEAAISCFADGDFSKEALMAYENKVAQELGYGMSLASLIVQLIRNRSLNPIWLQTLELMAARARVDANYADIVGGILMGTVTPNQAINMEVFSGIVEQAFWSKGLTSWLEFVQDPSLAVKSSLETFQAGFEMAVQASQNPSAFFVWAAKSVASAISLAAAAPSRSESNSETT